jgi:hypothetical protein
MLLHHRPNGLRSTINTPSERGVLMAASYYPSDPVAQVWPMVLSQGVRRALRSALHALVQPTLAQAAAEPGKDYTIFLSLSCPEREALPRMLGSFVALPRSVRRLLRDFSGGFLFAKGLADRRSFGSGGETRETQARTSWCVSHCVRIFCS